MKKFLESFMKAKIGMNAYTLVPLFAFPVLFVILAACVPKPPEEDASVPPTPAPVAVSITDTTIPTMTPNGALNVATVYRIPGNANSNYVDKEIDFFTDPVTGCKYMNVYYGNVDRGGSLQTVKREIPCVPPLQ